MSNPVMADHQPAGNTAAVATIAAKTNYRIEGVMVHWSYDTTPTGGKLTIKSGTTTISEVDVSAAGPGFLPLAGFVATRGDLLSATLAAGGGSVLGKVALAAKYL